MLLGFLLVECTNTEGVVERLSCLEMSVLVLGFFCQSFGQLELKLRRGLII